MSLCENFFWLLFAYTLPKYHKKCVFITLREKTLGKVNDRHAGPVYQYIKRYMHISGGRPQTVNLALVPKHQAKRWKRSLAAQSGSTGKTFAFHRPACARAALDRPISVSRAATSVGEGVVRLQRQ